jgi:hypothetical protein
LLDLLTFIFEFGQEVFWLSFQNSLLFFELCHLLKHYFRWICWEGRLSPRSILSESWGLFLDYNLKTWYSWRELIVDHLDIRCYFAFYSLSIWEATANHLKSGHLFLCFIAIFVFQIYDCSKMSNTARSSIGLRWSSKGNILVKRCL